MLVVPENVDEQHIALCGAEAGLTYSGEQPECLGRGTDGMRAGRLRSRVGMMRASYIEIGAAQIPLFGCLMDSEKAPGRCDTIATRSIDRDGCE